MLNQGIRICQVEKRVADKTLWSGRIGRGGALPVKICGSPYYPMSLCDLVGAT